MTSTLELKSNTRIRKRGPDLVPDLGGPGQSQENQPMTFSSSSQCFKPRQQDKGGRLTIHEKLAIELHEYILQYLKEHEVKMKILHV